MRALLALLVTAFALATTRPAGASSPSNAPDPAGQTGDAAMAEHADPVASYTLSARLDPVSHAVHGEGTIHWKNASSTAVGELWVHLYLNAFKNDRSVYLRDPVGGFRGTSPVRDWGAIDVRTFKLRAPGAVPIDLWPDRELHEDETDARVPLPREVAPGESIDIDVTWDDKLPGLLERTGYAESFHFVGQWFPKIARLEPSGQWAHFPFHHLAEFYADFGTYDVTLDVPSSFVVGATGPLIDAKVAAGRRIERHVQTDIHDFAWTAYDRFDERKEVIDGIVVQILFPRGYDVDAERELRTMRFAIPHFGALYGPYPYSVLTLVHPPKGAEEAGGMEYPTLITTGGPWYEPPMSRVLELVTMHEFGHQYFYGLVATDEASWPFLDEGVNSYAEAEALDAWLGAGSAGRLGSFTLSDNAVQSVFGNRAEHDEPVALAASSFPTGGDYSLLVYERTAAILETFRRVYGAASVARALGRYARRFRFQHPGPDDLIESFDREVGDRAAESLRVALFDEGWVDYTVTAISSKRSESAAGIFDRDGKRETLPAGQSLGSSYEGWVLVSRRGTLAFPVDVELTREDGTTETARWSGEETSTRIPYRGTVALKAAVVDPLHAVLLDDDPSNNHAAVDPARRAPWVSERLTYWSELLLQALVP
jgi:hypothetical protein